jgi:hypothetical protein
MALNGYKITRPGRLTTKTVEGHGFQSDIEVEMVVREWLRLQRPTSTAMMYLKPC